MICSPPIPLTQFPFAGIGRSISRIDQIDSLQRPLTMEDGGVVLMDLLWSDPTTNDGVEGVQPSPRGPGLVTFGPDRVKEFCKVRVLLSLFRWMAFVLIECWGFRRPWLLLLAFVIVWKFKSFRLEKCGSVLVWFCVGFVGHTVRFLVCTALVQYCCLLCECTAQGLCSVSRSEHKKECKNPLQYICNVGRDWAWNLCTVSL